MKGDNISPAKGGPSRGARLLIHEDSILELILEVAALEPGDNLQLRRLKSNAQRLQKGIEK